MRAIQLSNKIQEMFSVNVDLLEIFKNPSIREISLLVSKEKENIIEGSLWWKKLLYVEQDLDNFILKH